VFLDGLHSHQQQRDHWASFHKLLSVARWGVAREARGNSGNNLHALGSVVIVGLVSYRVQGVIDQPGVFVFRHEVRRLHCALAPPQTGDWCWSEHWRGSTTLHFWRVEMLEEFVCLMQASRRY
jgi:hypothetical protein